MDDQLYEELSKKFEQRLNQELYNSDSTDNNPMKAEDMISLNNNMIHSKDYLEFKKEFYPKELTLYEKLCKQAAKFMKVTPKPKVAEQMQKDIDDCHLNITPGEAMSLAYVGPVVIYFVLAFISVFFGLLINDVNAIVFLVGAFLMVAMYLVIVFSKIPNYLANMWRLKASNNIIQSVFYVVTYLRHTPNLERAMDFASEHLPPPLSLDFKKILWDVESGQYSTIKQSIDAYLTKWESRDPSYVDAFEIIISSLNEGDESKRRSLLDKALSTVLDGSYEEMIAFTRNLKQPITMIHMFGVVLPMLATVLMPMVVSFSPNIRWYHLGFFYDILLPMIIYFLSKNALVKRPAATTVTSQDIAFQQNKKSFTLYGFKINMPLATFSVLVAISFIFLSLMPVTVFKAMYPNDLKLISIGQLNINLLDYKQTNSRQYPIRGPYSLVASLFGLLLPFGIGIAVGIYHLVSSQDIMKVREKTIKLENEFATTLFQLSNRLSDGLPAEIAFQKVAASLNQSTLTYDFFNIVTQNLSQRGLGLQEALFDAKYGAISKYPSPLIKSSMKILALSAEKGPKIASESVYNVALYMKEIKEVNRKVNDLFESTLSSMRSIVAFMAPVLMGIILGLAVLISTVIVTLHDYMNHLTSGGGGLGSSRSLAGIGSILGYGVPSYYFNIIIGLYVVAVVYILSQVISVIQNGPDEIVESFTVGKNLVKTSLSFTMISSILSVSLSIVAMVVISSGM